MLYYSVFLTALFVSMVLVALLMHWAVGWKLVDVSNERKVHSGAIPRVGGIGMVLGTVTTLGVWLNFQVGPRYFLLGVLIIAAFGLWDDRANLNYKMKFFGQGLAILAVMLPGDLLIGHLSFTGCEQLPPWVAAPLTIFFLLGMTNAMNLSDGLDGLAGGVSLLTLLCIIILASLSNANEVMVLGLAIGGSTLGFLRYNTHPAMVFMGDTGSQFLGFSLGVLTIWLTQTANSALAPELALFILGLPVIDTVTVMTQRILEGRSPFKPDKNHFHHKLLVFGLDHYEAVLTIYAIQALFVSAAYALRYESGWLIIGLYAGVALLLGTFQVLAVRLRWRAQATLGQVQESWLARRLRALGEQRWLNLYPIYGIGMLIPVFLLASALIIDIPSAEIGNLSAGALILGVVSATLPSSAQALLQRVIIYVGVILMIYMMNSVDESAIRDVETWLRAYFIVLALLLAVGVRYSGREYFSLNTSDFLVMFILLASAYLPISDDFGHAELALESAVALYGVEFLKRRARVFSAGLWWSANIAFAMVAARALL